MITPVPIPHLPGFSSIIVEGHQLRGHPCLEQLQITVNNAFREGEHDRFPSIEHVITTPGVHGRCCVVFRDGDVDMTSPVATAMIKYYNPDVGVDPIRIIDRNGNVVNTSEFTKSEPGYDSEPADFLSITHWEPAAVAILSEDPSLKKLGLAVYCVNQLEIDLLRRLSEARRKRPAVPDIQNGNHGLQTTTGIRNLTFWIRCKEHAVPYWERRGYGLVQKKVYPKGVWGSRTELNIVTLKRDVSYS
ncbi:predicted protein [Uncinocarpus reesii 1704]|uniref:N-acetyltransferase domain-containing protein n=1 Tax=Uncinocarpus reesii (strain UAMH 1704) TaxID=336963 RepID=C4JHV8_UNCRE|nr:uncharacterized protein UREG_01383 [Uncinocarpus reesii 1704]EEP76534.1 predicted protein [Uncinocarpus reesii 1704]